MADQDIGSLDALAGASVSAANDLLPIVDASDGASGTTKQLSVAQLYTALTQTGGVLSATEPRFGLSTSGTAAANTTALAAIATEINSLGGAILVVPPGTYNFNGPTDGSAVCSFSSLNGLTIIAPGAIFADQSTYTGSQTGILFKFTTCKNFSVARPKITSAIDTTNVRGLHAFYLIQGCEGYSLDWEQEGGLSGCAMVRVYTDDDSYRSRHYKLMMKCTDTHYPVNGQFSGDDGEVHLDATRCTRSFFYYGCSHLKIFARVKNRVGTSLLKAYNGYGLSDVYVNYYDRESSTANSLPFMTLDWGDSTAAVHRDIRLHWNVKSPSGAFRFNKYSSDGVPDSTGRGHQLLGLDISGSSERSTGENHIELGDGAFVKTGTPDVIKGIRFHDFIGTGATVIDDWDVMAAAFSDVIAVDNVNYTTNLYFNNGTNGRVVFRNCTATALQANGRAASVPPTFLTAW